jgi:uncharacterized protein YecE (DUF72 family)
MAGTPRIGISGWRYPPWRGDFYPKGLPQRSELEYASSKLSSIEINGSFYSLQRPSSWQAWRDTVPDDFVFSVKGPRYVTHLKGLRDVRVPIANFFASGVLALGQKLGPVLWQLPPRHVFRPDLLAEFFDQLPRTTDAARALAAEHDTRLDGKTWFEKAPDAPLRHALEVRHPSFETPEAVALLRKHDIALVVADTAGKWPAMRDVTSTFMYLRLHGADELYTSGYTDEGLDRWAADIRAWLLAGDVFCYFDNDVKVRAPYDAMALAARLA